MEPENEGLEDDVPFQTCRFSGSMLILKRCMYVWDENLSSDYFIDHDIRIPCLNNQDDSWKVLGRFFVARLKWQPSKLDCVSQIIVLWISI